MLKKFLLFLLFISSTFVSIHAQTQSNADTVMILPFENKSGKPEFNWVGESFALSLSELLKLPSINVVSNGERKSDGLRSESLAVTNKVAGEQKSIHVLTKCCPPRSAAAAAAAAAAATTSTNDVGQRGFFMQNCLIQLLKKRTTTT